MSDKKTINATTIRILKDDLTAMEVEAFVFYARTDLALGSGYGNAISTRGGPSIKKELDEIGSVQPLNSVVTGAGELNAEKIVHAAGPAFQEPDINSKLAVTVENALKEAEKNGIKQLAFPIMGIGFYGIPIDVSINTMLTTFKNYLASNNGIEEIIICANDNRELRPLSAQLEKFS